MKLFKVVLRAGCEVPFMNATDSTLLDKDSHQLEFDPDKRVIFAKCKRADRDPVIIPIESVRYIVEAATAVTPKLVAEANAVIARKATEAEAEKVKPKVDDVVKLIKGEGGALGTLGPDGRFLPLETKPLVQK